jgi:hypothetical protein
MNLLTAAAKSGVRSLISLLVGKRATQDAPLNSLVGVAAAAGNAVCGPGGAAGVVVVITPDGIAGVEVEVCMAMIQCALAGCATAELALRTCIVWSANKVCKLKIQI